MRQTATSVKRLRGGLPPGALRGRGLRDAASHRGAQHLHTVNTYNEHICVYIYIYIHIYIHTCIYIYIYTYVHYM